MRKYRPAVAMILLVIYANFIAGCFHNFYKVTIPESDKSLLDQIHESESYFIIHQGYSAWHMNAITLNVEQTELSGELEELPVSHHKYLTAVPDKPNRYKPSKEDPAIEVHLYISEYTEGQSNRIIVPISDIQKVEIYDIDKEATNSAFAGSMVVIGIMVGGVVVGLLGGLALYGE